MKRLALLLLLAAGATGSRAMDVPSLGIGNLTIDADTSAIVLRMDVNPGHLRPGSDAELIVTPVLSSADGAAAYSMPPVVIAGRTRYIRNLRNPSALPAGAEQLRAGDSRTTAYTARLPYSPDMVRSRVSLDVRRSGCCGKSDSASTRPVAEIDLAEKPFEAPEFVADVPVVADGKTVELHGSALVSFRVNRTEIDPLYMNNPAELHKITGTIEQAFAVPDATITGITIHGFASPEGRYSNNERLAAGRTLALKEYVQQRYALADSIFTTSSTPEDWAGLRDTVAVLALPDKAALLEVIDSDMEPDARDAELRRRFPDTYAYLLRAIYPSLRHSDYTVRYAIRQYTDLNEIRRVMMERPGHLSLHEFYLLVASCPAGSEERIDVLERASRVYPDAPESVYLRGMAAARRADYDEARRLFGRARDAGIAEANRALDALDAMHRPTGVTYIPQK